jgi:hypothetical protein
MPSATPQKTPERFALELITVSAAGALARKFRASDKTAAGEEEQIGLTRKRGRRSDRINGIDRKKI